MSRLPIPFSFELFPPKTPEGAEKLKTTVGSLHALGPDYFSVTYGAGGTTQAGTRETVAMVAAVTGAAAAPHLTCIGATKAGTAALVDDYKSLGVDRIVALRGDLPVTAYSTRASGEMAYAANLVAFLRERHGEHFHVEVAAYPEGHPQATDAEADFANYAAKVRAGASGAVTQYFYNVDAYFDFAERSARAGLDIPLVAGVMPIVNVDQLLRFSAACGAEIPRWLERRLGTIKQDPEAVKAFGLDVMTRLCERLIAGGAPGIHFYTLNQAPPTMALVERLAA